MGKGQTILKDSMDMSKVGSRPRAMSAQSSEVYGGVKAALHSPAGGTDRCTRQVPSDRVWSAIVSPLGETLTVVWPPWHGCGGCRHGDWRPQANRSRLRD